MNEVRTLLADRGLAESPRPVAAGAFRPGSVAQVAADGSVRQVADDIVFPNGMAVTAGNSTLFIVAAE